MGVSIHSGVAGRGSGSFSITTVHGAARRGSDARALAVRLYGMCIGEPASNADESLGFTTIYMAWRVGAVKLWHRRHVKSGTTESSFISTANAFTAQVMPLRRLQAAYTNTDTCLGIHIYVVVTVHVLLLVSTAAQTVAASTELIPRSH